LVVILFQQNGNITCFVEGKSFSAFGKYHNHTEATYWSF